jgi:Domain of unknown function (DUF4388)
MAKGRDNVAESLGDILQIVSARRRSGLLSVERYEAGRFEEGEVYFQKGRPVHARFGMMSSQEAMAKLLTWRHVYYAFIADVPVPSTSVPPAGSPDMAPARPGIEPLTQVPPQVRNTTGPVPAPAWQTQESPAHSAPPSVRPAHNLPVTNPQPQIRRTQPPSFLQQPATLPPERTTGYNQPPLRNISSLPGFESLVPRRMNNEQDVLSLPLTRTQRSIFLLVDGSRTVADLARCISKSAQDVGRLLAELEQLGFVLL